MAVREWYQKYEEPEGVSFSEKEKQECWIGSLTIIGIIILLLHFVGIL